MPIHRYYDAESDILVLQPEGGLTMDMIRALNDKVINCDEYPPYVNTIWDMRKTDYRNINKQFLEELIELRKEIMPVRGKAKLAYVASSDFEFGITRMYEMLSVDIPQQMHIFRTIEEAKQWLTSSENGDEC